MAQSNRGFLSRRQLGFGLLALTALTPIMAPRPAWSEAGDHVDLNLTESGVAVNGFDPVAYFTDGRPVMGSPQIAHRYKGATYYFANDANRQAFIDDPDMFMPAYGGFCAYGVRTGRKFQIDPYAWRIVDDRLYLLLNPGTQVIWELQRGDNIRIADAIWPKIQPFTDAELEKRAP